MRKRLISGIAMAIGAVLILLYAPAWSLLLALLVVSTLCFLEYAHVMGFVLKDPLVWIAAVLQLLAWGALIAHEPAWASSAFLIAVMVMWVCQFAQSENMVLAMSRLAVLVFGMVYLQLLWFPLASLIGYSANEITIGHPRGFLFFLLATTHAADAAAYFGGKRFGKHAFAPRISPKKTWEGWVAGIIGSVIAGFICNLLFGLQLTGMQTLVFSIALGVAASLGDLAESMLKRSREVKDSGHWIPGHGGILDRVDGLFFSGPVLYFILTVVLKIA